MSDQDHRFADVMRQERQRLDQERQAIFNQQRELESKLAVIDREMAAIEAYESTKSGKQTAGARQARGSGRARARRGSKREQLLQLIRQHPDGLARKDILEKMGLKGDKSGEMSVSNALTALTKTNQVSRHEGKYRFA